MIEISDLTKDVRRQDGRRRSDRDGVGSDPTVPGRFTTMRMILGLDRATGGQVLVNGRRFARSAHESSTKSDLLRTPLPPWQ
jgi:hypothetical protein